MQDKLRIVVWLTMLGIVLENSIEMIDGTLQEIFIIFLQFCVVYFLKKNNNFLFLTVTGQHES